MTQIELLYDKNFNPYFTAQIRAGYVIDAPYGSFSHLLSNEDLTRRSGPFIKIGIKTHLNNKIITPFLGFRIVNSLSMEKGLGGCPSYLLCTGSFSKLGYNLGIGCNLGVSLKIKERIALDIGIQIGFLIINNLVNYDSFAPGMGVNWYTLRTQGIFQLRYKLN